MTTPGPGRGPGPGEPPAGIELRHLRAFAAVARRRSFTAAAAELLITRPALSRTVVQLETALGVRLLDRSPRHVDLTDHPAPRFFPVAGAPPIPVRLAYRSDAGVRPVLLRRFLEAARAATQARY